MQIFFGTPCISQYGVLLYSLYPGRTPPETWTCLPTDQPANMTSDEVFNNNNNPRHNSKGCSLPSLRHGGARHVAFPLGLAWRAQNCGAAGRLAGVNSSSLSSSSLGPLPRVYRQLVGRQAQTGSAGQGTVQAGTLWGALTNRPTHPIKCRYHEGVNIIKVRIRGNKKTDRHFLLDIDITGEYRG